MRAARRPLVLLAHGTADEGGRQVVYDIAAAVSRQLPATDVAVGFVDVCEPGADEVLAAYPAAVVVPYLLTTGYHVRHDIPGAVARYGRNVSITPALGVTPEVVKAICDRVVEAQQGAPRGAGGNRGGSGCNRESSGSVDAVVLAGAGSSDVGARREVLCLAALVAASVKVPVRAGFLSGTGPPATSCVSQLRSEGARYVAVAPALLAPGYFLKKARGLDADIVSQALGVHRSLVDLVVRRYGEAS
ncbi:sirohydrochlorin chelatase [soil metagenome]